MNSRAKTKEEIREEFLNHIRSLKKYWMTLPNKTLEERIDGLIFSILCIFDGSTNLPAFNISCFPHHSDKQYCKDNDENWYPPDLIINNDCCLHEMWYMKKIK